MRWDALLDFVFPPQCAACNALGSGLCGACTPPIERITVRLPGLRVRAFGAYESGLKAAILAVKDGRRDVAERLGNIVAPIILPGSLLVAVPTSAKRRRVRGVDGVALIARVAAALAGARVLAPLYQRRDDAQRGRSRLERLAARGRFGCHAEAVAGQRVVLFDDVCTTGATLRDCATALREAGAVCAEAAVVAVAMPEAGTLAAATNSREPWRATTTP
ncbi:MAG: ComF family protein [Candidatus Eremiobacteraeota bacterium]|nr:ComF family protein [Candidatus Eremiobacteraeota bacterium]